MPRGLVVDPTRLIFQNPNIEKHTDGDLGFKAHLGNLAYTIPLLILNWTCSTSPNDGD